MTTIDEREPKLWYDVIKQGPEASEAWLKSHPAYEELKPKTIEGKWLAAEIDSLFSYDQEPFLSMIDKLSLDEVKRWGPFVRALPKTYHIKILKRYKDDLPRMQALFLMEGSEVKPVRVLQVHPDDAEAILKAMNARTGWGLEYDHEKGTTTIYERVYHENQAEA